MRTRAPLGVYLVAATWCVLLGLSVPAAGWADATAPGETPPAEAATSPAGWNPIERVRTDPWRFHFGIYGWLPEAPADITIGPNTVGLPEDLDTILDSLRFTAMLHGEAHKGPIGFFISPIYYNGEYDDDIKGPLGGKNELTVEESVWVIDYGVSYEFGPWPLFEGSAAPTMTLEPFVGGRFFNDHINVDIDLPLVGDTSLVRETLNFNTPIVGLKSRWDFGERWTVFLEGDTGGWDVDDVEDTYQLWGTVGYNFHIGSVPSKVFAGYRYLFIDYEPSPVELKVRVRGPLVGLAFDF